ncbi:accessory Sec system translocase SecA2 [Streptococcus pluranimalium]|uniref:accessory Sec system translocase SecA2 n=1 Tax=Streptococcus pluranimalium TaxID=82348 RepID=UPI004046EE82
MPRQKTKTFSERLQIRKLQKIVDDINLLKNRYRKMSDDDLRNQTTYFKECLLRGATLDDLLVEAFATVREVCFRILGKFPFDVQVMGGIALHQGMIAEMKTGEGKTITATMPLYLNALLEKGAILVTTNEYLAQRDADEMGPVYEFLGMTIGVALSDETEEEDVASKREIYASDITYTTSTGLGFDYLVDNLASSKDEKFLRPFHYVIVDEADAVLLDNAQTPLIISGVPRVQSNLYTVSNQFVISLGEDDYFFDKERNFVYFTDEGITYAEQYFAIDNLFDNRYWELNRHLNLALRAHYLYTKNKEYIVQDNEVKLLDSATGRILEGTRLQSGIHQAIEMKEKVKLTRENRAIASVTYQSLFNMFPKLSGMTGTATQAADELIQTYKVPVVAIPTNTAIRRTDYPDLIYVTLPEKLKATIAMVRNLHEKGQPVLLVSGSVEITEIYSKLLLQEGIPHSTLTANNAIKEAMIIKEAGHLGTVTCATVMAGRGTDIKLGPGVAELGGLAVIGTERMANSRMDWQLIGRSGRQGDPGMSQFFVSLEDDLLINHGSKWLTNYLKKYQSIKHSHYGQPLRSRRFQRAIQLAQEKSEDKAILARQSTIQFDESLRVQRNHIYELRDSLMLTKDSVSEKIIEITNDIIDDLVETFKDTSQHELKRYILDHFSYNFRHFPNGFDISSRSDIKDCLKSVLVKEREKKIEELQTEEAIEEFYQLSIIKAIDTCWVEEVDTLQQLKGVVSTRKNGLSEYYRESLLAYENLSKEVKHLILRNIMLSTIEKTPTGNVSIYFV